MAELNTCKSFNPWYLLAMAIGAMIGPWVVMMQWWVQLSGPSIGLAFTLVGIMCIPIALVYGEMTAMLPFTGGPFVYVNSAFGKHAAFWSTWGLLLAYLSVLGFLIMAAIQLVQFLWWPDMTQFQLVVIGIIVAILIYLLASRSIIVSATAQFVMTVLMLLVAVVVILMFTTHETFTTANWSPFFATGTDGFFTGAALMITMYFGFELVPQFVQECNYPARSFWKIILGSLAFTIVFYSILPLVDSGMLPWSELQNTEMVDATIGGQLFGRWFQYMVAGVALLAIITTLTGFWLASARILFSMGQARILPAWFDKLNKNETPGNASVVILAICIFFMIASGTNWLAALLALMATGLGIAYTGSSLAFLQLRRKYPQWARPWKLPAGNLLGVLAVLASLAIFYFSAKYLDALMWKVFAAYAAIGAIIWLVMIYEARRNPENYAVKPRQGVVEGAE
ncbi:MAG: APC family permease [Thermoleophilia bacterium]